MGITTNIKPVLSQQHDSEKGFNALTLGGFNHGVPQTGQIGYTGPNEYQEHSSIAKLYNVGLIGLR